MDEKQKAVLLTEDGYEAVEDVLQVTDLYDPRTQWASFVINALKARARPAAASLSPLPPPAPPSWVGGG